MTHTPWSFDALEFDDYRDKLSATSLVPLASLEEQNDNWMFR